MFRRFYLEIIIHTAQILPYFNIPEKPSENGGLLCFFDYLSRSIYACIISKTVLDYE